MQKDEERVLYDVIQHMVHNVVIALRKETVDVVDPQIKAVKVKAAGWGDSFLTRLDEACEYKRYTGTLHADLNDGSWSLRIKAVKTMWTVDYRHGEFLFSTMGAEYFQINMNDPTHPSVRTG